MAVIVASVLAFLVPSFLLFGLLVTELNGDTVCGAIGHLRVPECDSISWEFGVGAGAVLLVILVLVILVVGCQGCQQGCPETRRTMPCVSRLARSLVQDEAQKMPAPALARHRISGLAMPGQCLSDLAANVSS